MCINQQSWRIFIDEETFCNYISIRVCVCVISFPYFLFARSHLFYIDINSKHKHARTHIKIRFKINSIRETRGDFYFWGKKNELKKEWMIWPTKDQLKSNMYIYKYMKVSKGINGNGSDCDKTSTRQSITKIVKYMYMRKRLNLVFTIIHKPNSSCCHFFVWTI